MYAASALVVGSLLEQLGSIGFLTLARKVQAERIEDLRPLVKDLAIPNMVGNCNALGLGDQVGLAEGLHRDFLVGNASGANDTLIAVRRAQQKAGSPTKLERQYLMALTLAAGGADAAALRHELDIALDSYVRRYPDEPLSFALCICREGIRCRFASDFVEVGESYRRGREISKAAMRRFPLDPDVLSAVAKFELSSPSEYGGNPNACANLLVQAAAAMPDSVISAEFRKAAVRLVKESA